MEIPMAREMVLRFVAEGISARVLLLEDEAPRTCAALWRALPVSGEALHAAYSGTEIALLIDPSIEIEEENATECIQTGDVMYTHYKPGVRHGHLEAGSGIHWAYDRYVRPTPPRAMDPRGLERLRAHRRRRCGLLRRVPAHAPGGSEDHRDHAGAWRRPVTESLRKNPGISRESSDVSGNGGIPGWFPGS
jgi:hypothetical protein